mgnify:CR=1 FL=1
MKKIYVSADPVQCGWLESLLQASNIECLVRNRFLGGAIGELPINEAWPEIWVVNDNDEARAESVIADALAPLLVTEDWRCAGCQEWVEGQFGSCWQCGHVRESNPAA